jgi:hypothetical protein
VTVELDLIGLKLTLSDEDSRVLLVAAEASSGSSLGSRDLATRLRETEWMAPRPRRRLVLTRPEARSLQRLLENSVETGERLPELRSALEEILHRGERPPEHVAS